MAEKAAQQTVMTQEHVPNSEHGGGFPPFQKDTFASQILWLAITFIALYVLMARVALPRIGGILEERRSRIDGDLAEAERLKGESDTAMVSYQKALSDARARAQSLANERREREAAAADARRKELDSTLSARIADAEKVIAERKSAAMANVRGIATEAASAIVERLIGATPTSHDVDAAVAAVLKN
jgi:F-type H+-transporting ATPase subunit b